MNRWIKDRMQEPSSFAAAGVVIVGVGVLLDNSVVVMVAVIAAGIAFVLKEKGIL
jgi:hypothetical protein|tara:strand:+ start:273 stop:437 length:165 start_codon:yes stop_codon:yes gene_type:complete